MTKWRYKLSYSNPLAETEGGEEEGDLNIKAWHFINIHSNDDRGCSAHRSLHSSGNAEHLQEAEGQTYIQCQSLCQTKIKEQFVGQFNTLFLVRSYLINHLSHFLFFNVKHDSKLNIFFMKKNLPFQSPVRQGYSGTPCVAHTASNTGRKSNKSYILQFFSAPAGSVIRK